MPGDIFHTNTLEVLDGRLLLFDNLGHKGRSRVIEFDPFDLEIVWEYVNPFRAGNNDELIAAVMDMEVLDEAFDLSWVGGGRCGALQRRNGRRFALFAILPASRRP